MLLKPNLGGLQEMNIDEAAKFLGVSTKTMRRYLKKGLVQGKIIEGEHGKEYEIEPVSLESFKVKKSEESILPTVEPSKKQSGRAIATLDNPRTLDILDLGQGRVAHHKDLRMGEPSRYIDSQPDILTVQEVADYLGIGVSTVRDYLRDGLLKGAKIGKGWKISKDSLKAFVKKLLG